MRSQRSSKDVHTEHCCARHGCKYGEENCTVVTGKKKQSFPCETCLDPETQREDLWVRIKDHLADSHNCGVCADLWETMTKLDGAC